MRTFEIPGIGGVQLAPNTQEHRAFFKEGVNIFLFDNEFDCTKKIKMLLELNSKEIDLIRRSARETCINDEHSYAQRSIFVLNSFYKYFH